MQEIEAHLLELIEERVVPHVQADGGDIRYERYDPESGVVTISLLGACVDCPSATITMRFMIKNVPTARTLPALHNSRARAQPAGCAAQLLMHYCPEVTNVVRLGVDDDLE